MDYMYYVEEFIFTVMDALEEFMNTVSIPTGKKLYEVFGILLGFLGFSLICKFIGLATFVSWVEALVACIIMGVILLTNNISKSKVEKVRKRLQMGGKK